jgi:hypothetical protein
MPKRHFQQEFDKLREAFPGHFGPNRDPKDGQLGRIGYEIPFNRHFYEFQSSRELSAIDADLKSATDRIIKLIEGLS